MALAARMHEGIAVVHLDGPRLDAANADSFKNDLKEMIDNGQTRVVLDFEKVQFMDSSGLGAIVGCLKYMGADGTIEIARPSSTIMKILKLTRMNKVFTIRDAPPSS
ncbi:MAG: STAS domain-containing protein [Pseudomonadota bacterium]